MATRLERQVYETLIGELHRSICSDEMAPLWHKVFVLSSSRNERRFDTADSCAGNGVR